MSIRHNAAKVDKIHPNDLRDFAIRTLGSLRKKSHRLNKANKNLIKQGETIEKLKAEIKLLEGKS